MANSKGFKNFVNTKIKGGFDSRKMPIELETAIQNSIKNFEVEQNQPKLYSTEAHLLGRIPTKEYPCYGTNCKTKHDTPRYRDWETDRKSVV